MVLMSSGKRWSLDAADRERNPLSALSSEIDTCRSLVGERKGIVGKGKILLLMGF